MRDSIRWLMRPAISGIGRRRSIGVEDEVATGLQLSGVLPGMFKAAGMPHCPPGLGRGDPA
jgi:hypothetical protein